MTTFHSKTPRRSGGAGRTSRRLHEWPSRLWRVATARPNLAAAVIYAVLAMALFGQGATPGRVLTGSDQLWSVAPFAASAPPLSRSLGANHELNDAADVFEPFLEYTEARLPTRRCGTRTS